MKIFYEYEDLVEMGLPENLLIFIRETLDDVLISKVFQKVTCDLTPIFASLKNKKIIKGNKKFVQFLIFSSGLIMIESLDNPEDE